MTYLFIDTETTGLPKKHGELIQDNQARICQIAMILTDKKGVVLNQHASLIKPKDWIIGDIASGIHGFTNEDCEKYGLSMIGVYVLFERLAAMADIIVAHNVTFDKKLMQIEAAYGGRNFIENKWYCTMENSTHILDLPPTERMLEFGINKPKNPNLNEALKFFCGREMREDAHNAIYDTEACRDVFFGIKTYESIE